MDNYLRMSVLILFMTDDGSWVMQKAKNVWNFFVSLHAETENNSM